MENVGWSCLCLGACTTPGPLGWAHGVRVWRPLARERSGSSMGSSPLGSPSAEPPSARGRQVLGAPGSPALFVSRAEVGEGPFGFRLRSTCAITEATFPGLYSFASVLDNLSSPGYHLTFSLSLLGRGLTSGARAPRTLLICVRKLQQLQHVQSKKS